jgi:hypothetical protein
MSEAIEEAMRTLDDVQTRRISQVSNIARPKVPSNQTRWRQKKRRTPGGGGR